MAVVEPFKREHVIAVCRALMDAYRAGSLRSIQVQGHRRERYIEGPWVEWELTGQRTITIELDAPRGGK